MTHRRPGWPLAAVLVGLVVAACSSGGATPAPSAAAPASPVAGGTELTIYGAASLKGALEKAKTAYEPANPGTTLTINTDSSATL
ncbi:MAG TPA: hypothetical protein VIZ22_07205, partial [Candidatus Limnocylindrales bacterium]